MPFDMTPQSDPVTWTVKDYRRLTLVFRPWELRPAFRSEVWGAASVEDERTRR